MKGVEELGCELDGATWWGCVLYMCECAPKRKNEIIESSSWSPHVYVCDARAQRSAVGAEWAGVRREGHHLVGRRVYM